MSRIDKEASAKRFGTFGGVFNPVTLKILGVIVFLRFGQITGYSGIAHTIVILLLAFSIVTLTALSLSAIVTNTRVRGGGAYFLISRSLGVEFGGTIGVMLYVALALAVALYVIGFTEAFVDVFPAIEAAIGFRTIATVVNLLILVSVLVSAGWAIKIQYFILVVLALSLGSFWLGAIDDFSIQTLKEGIEPTYLHGTNFFMMFALFFPAVTGIMAGANMSGDLKDPSRSIPRGTLAAIGVTAIIYLSLSLVLAGARSNLELINDPLIMKDIAVAGWMVTVGIFATTLSAGLSSMMGASRILQAFARDNIFPRLRVFARGSKGANEPRLAIILTFLIAETAIFLGDLNAIAPIITMFFMITYGMINLATFYESITKNPSYRPRFRFGHWTTELLGALACAIVMFLISPMWAVIAFATIGALYWYIARKQFVARWGDVKHGVAFERARKNLLRLEDEDYHPKNWRPMILALSGGAWSRLYLAVYGHWLAGGNGVLTLAQIIVGDIRKLLERRRNQERLLSRFIGEEGLAAFPAVVVAPSIEQGIQTLVQASGIGAVRPNTVLIGWTRDSSHSEAFGTTLRTISGLGRSIVAIKTGGLDKENAWAAQSGTIDVWWRGRMNGTLMLLLAHLLVQNNEWRGRTVRLLRVIPSEAGRAEAEKHLNQLIELARIRAQSVIIVADDVPTAIHEVSTHAAITMLGFTPPESGREESFIQGIDRLTDGLGTTILVSSAGGMDLEA